MTTVACAIFLAGAVVAAAGEGPVQRALKRLESPTTSTSGASEVIRLARSNPKDLRYVARQVSPIIRRGPGGGVVWASAVSVAGALRLAEASGVLAKWIDAEWGPGTVTLGQTARLEDRPAAMALKEIGGPAIPAVLQVLKGGNESERCEAIFVLDGFHSAAAKKALTQHEPAEHSRELRDLIRRTLASW